MTLGTEYARRRPVMPAAAMAGLLLAGCSSGHIGDSWQCPLAEGGACNSVAAADPAVPDTGATRKTLLTEPLWRQRAGEPREPVAAPCEAECGGGFDPFGWLMRLVGGGEGEERAATEETRPGVAAVSRAAEPAAVPPPVEPAPGEEDPDEDDPGGDSLRGDDLRTGEVVARIWIAPFVDADGIYREQFHVRVVLEPAGWRLPR